MTCRRLSSTSRTGRFVPRSIHRAASFLAATTILLGASSTVHGRQVEKLVPASFSQITDSQGFLWDLNAGGYVNRGTNHCFSSAEVLTINGSNFNVRQRMMKPKTRELVLSGSHAGLQITRRIKVDTKIGAARYVEMFHNPGRSAITANLILHVNLNNTCQAFVTDKGAPLMGVLGKQESGLAVIRRPGDNRPGALLFFGGASSKVKPSIQNQNNHVLQARYSLSVPPGKTVSILHGVAQRHLSARPNLKALAALFKPFRSRKWLADLPSAVRKTVVNLRGMRGAGGGAPNLATLDDLEVERGATDVLAFGEETRLRGNATCAGLNIETPYGTASVPFEKVAAIVGGRRSSSGGQLFLRDGEILSGKLTARSLRFAMISGLTVEVTIGTLDRLVTRAHPDDGAASESTRAFIETATRNRLAIVGGLDETLSLVTTWGKMTARLGEVRWLRTLEDDQPGHTMRLRDGTRGTGFIDDTEITVETLFFGSQKVRPAEIRSITFVEPGKRRTLDEPELSEAHVLLAGENVLLGSIDLPQVHFLIAGESLASAPGQIRSLHNEDEGESEGAPMLSGELWGGGTISGQLRETVLPIRARDTVYQVPVRDLLEVSVPSPAISDSLRSKVAQRIRELGDPDWEKREAASRDLAEVGYLAKRQLTEAHQQTTDAEVRRRTKALLDEIE